jgi:hypothetical protein
MASLAALAAGEEVVLAAHPHLHFWNNIHDIYESPSPFLGRALFHIPRVF